MWEWALDAPSPSAEAQGTQSANCIQTHCVPSWVTKANNLEEEIGKKSASQQSDILFGGDGEPSPRWVNTHSVGSGSDPMFSLHWNAEIKGAIEIWSIAF